MTDEEADDIYNEGIDYAYNQEEYEAEFFEPGTLTHIKTYTFSAHDDSEAEQIAEQRFKNEFGDRPHISEIHSDHWKGKP